MSKLEKTDIDGCLISEQFATEICKHMDDNDIHAAPPSAATSIPIADNETDADIRTGQLGTSDDYARADHNHPIRRQSNP